MIKRYFGNKAFYKMALTVAVPIAIQNFITNFVNLLDNLMVGRVGTEQMSGVSIVNQLLFVFNLAIFGAVSGAGIFTSQFYGKKDEEGIRNTLKIKIGICTLIGVVGILVFIIGGGFLIKLYLHDGSAESDIESTFLYAKQYLNIMLIGLLPFALSQAFSGTLRETGETLVPMIASFVAVGVNCIFNYLLIFGKFGFPQMGVQGAAIATILSRYLELIILVVYAIVKRNKFTYFKGLFKTIKIPTALLKSVGTKGMPLMFNEFCWSAGMSLLSMSYSLHGIDVVAAYSISSTVINLFNAFFLSLGVAAGIIVGNMLGANEFDKAVDSTRKLIVFSMLVSIGIGTCLFVTADLFPQFYNTNEASKELAGYFIKATCVFMPFGSIVNTSYFVMRSGGNVFLTILCDSVYIMTIAVPIAFALYYLIGANIYVSFCIVVGLDIVKATISIILLKKANWIHNIVNTI